MWYQIVVYQGHVWGVQLIDTSHTLMAQPLPIYCNLEGEVVRLPIDRNAYHPQSEC